MGQYKLTEAQVRERNDLRGFFAALESGQMQRILKDRGYTPEQFDFVVAVKKERKKALTNNNEEWL